MRTLSLLLAAILCPCAATAIAADWPAPMAAYQTELATVEAATEPVSLRPLFEAALAVQDYAMDIQDGQAWLEILTPTDYEALRQALRGLRLSRGQDVYAAPDPAFLAQLAQGHGGDGDRAFFEQYQRSWDDDLLPVYLRQTAAPTPCVRFAEGVIADRYLAWTDFRAAWPQAYAPFVQQAIADLEEVVALGTCACGDQASVERELQGFAVLFPHSPAAPAASARLQQLEIDPTRQPVHCR